MLRTTQPQFVLLYRGLRPQEEPDRISFVEPFADREVEATIVEPIPVAQSFQRDLQEIRQAPHHPLPL